MLFLAGEEKRSALASSGEWRFAARRRCGAAALSRGGKTPSSPVLLRLSLAICKGLLCLVMIGAAAGACLAAEHHSQVTQR